MTDGHVRPLGVPQLPVEPPQERAPEAEPEESEADRLLRLQRELAHWDFDFMPFGIYHTPR